jgi:hypothetical protein
VANRRLPRERTRTPELKLSAADCSAERLSDSKNTSYPHYEKIHSPNNDGWQPCQQDAARHVAQTSSPTWQTPQTGDCSAKERTPELKLDAAILQRRKFKRFQKYELSDL